MPQILDCLNKASRMRRGLTAGLLAVASMLAVVPGAMAQSGNTGPIRIVIGFTPGGALDTLARSVAEKLRATTGETVLVENRPGAGTRLAVVNVKHAAADGKTILISSPSPFTMMPLIYSKLDYDPDNDFVPVAQLAQVPTAVSVGMDQPYKTFPEYIAWLRKNPQHNSFGLIGLGNSTHMAMFNLGKQLGIPLTPVAYRGGSQLFTDVMAGHIPIGFDAVGSQLPLQRAGKLRIIGVSNSSRISMLPNIPTLAEVGYPDLNVSVWYAAFVPAATPKAIVEQLQKSFIDAVADPAFHAQMEAAGLVITGKPGQSVIDEIAAERRRLKPLVEASGFKAED